MSNDVEIVVKTRDRSEAGLASSRARFRRFTRDVEKETGRQRDELGRFVAGAGKGSGSQADSNGVEIGRKIAGGIRRGLAKLLSPAMLKGVAGSAAAAFGAQFIGVVASTLASGAAKLAHGFAAGLALLPAAGVAAAVALGAVKIALSGVGDALSAGLSGDTEKFNEALQGLSPSARNVVRDIAGLKGRLDELKGTVQENFFAPLVDSVQPLADRYLPMMQAVLGNVARTFGQVANGIASFLAMPSTAQAVFASLVHVRDAITNVATGVGSLVQAFLPLITVGSTFLPQLTDGFGGATARLATFMQEAERTGRLAEFIQGGIDKVRSLIDTGAQVGRILRDIGSIGQTVWGAMGIQTGGLLTRVEELTGRFDRFLQSARGSEMLAQVFGIVGSLLAGLRDTIERVAGTIGRVFGPIMPQLGELVMALSRLKAAVLDTGLDFLEPILMRISDVLGAVLLPALTGLANWLADNQPVLQGIGIAILTFLVPAFISWAISAGAAAIATLLAMAPIILLGVAIAALAALVIIHFDTIKRWISNVFNWVKDNWPLLLGILTGPIGWAVLLITSHWDKIKAGAGAVKDWIVARFNDVLGFFTGLPGRIASAASGMWDGITDAFKSAINALIRMWNNFEISFGGYDIPGPGPNIPSFTIGTPNIPYLAAGGIRSGMAVVGDRGAELMNLAPGTKVIPNNQARQMAAQGSTLNTSPTGPRGQRTWDFYFKAGKPRARILATGQDVALPAGIKEDQALGWLKARGYLSGAAGGGGQAPAPAPARSGRSSGGNFTVNGETMRLEIDLTGGDDLFLRWLRQKIQQAFGGNVQAALGPNQ